MTTLWQAFGGFTKFAAGFVCGVAVIVFLLPIPRPWRR